MCRQHPTKWWFAGSQSDTALARVDLLLIATVRAPCLEFALSRPDLLGIWAATTPTERTALRRDGRANGDAVDADAVDARHEAAVEIDLVIESEVTVSESRPDVSEPDVLSVEVDVSEPEPPPTRSSPRGPRRGWRDSAVGEQMELLTPAEAARKLGVTPNTVTRWSRAGKISAIQTMGGHRRFRRSEIERVLREANASATQSALTTPASPIAGRRDTGTEALPAPRFAREREVIATATAATNVTQPANASPVRGLHVLADPADERPAHDRRPEREQRVDRHARARGAAGADQICMCAFAVEPKNTAIAPTGTSAISVSICVGTLAATTSASPSSAAGADHGPRRRPGARRRGQRADDRADAEERHEEAREPGAAVERVARQQRQERREVVDERPDDGDEQDRRPDLGDAPRVRRAPRAPAAVRACAVRPVQLGGPHRERARPTTAKNDTALTKNTHDVPTVAMQEARPTRGR